MVVVTNSVALIHVIYNLVLRKALVHAVLGGLDRKQVALLAGLEAAWPQPIVDQKWCFFRWTALVLLVLSGLRL